MNWKSVYFYLSFLTCCLFTSAEKAVLHGKITLIGKSINKIPKGSCMEVKIEDARIADASPINIAKRVLKNQDLQLKNGAVLYNITFDQPKDSVEYTLGATLNMGWCRSNEDDWLHSGDFITTTFFNFDAKPTIHLYEKNIELEFYQTNTHKNEDPCRNAPCFNSICISYSNGTYSCKKLETIPCAVPMCADVHQPVCGSNGKTYHNECVMLGDSCIDGKQTDLYKEHDGECYPRHGMHESLLLTAGIITFATVGFIVVFLVWRRNRRIRMQKMNQYGVKKVAPLDL